jgi:hypothetical protein
MTIEQFQTLFREACHAVAARGFSPGSQQFGSYQHELCAEVTDALNAAGLLEDLTDPAQM